MGRVKKNQNSQESSHNEIRITYSQIMAIITLIGSLVTGATWVSQGYSDYKNTSRITLESQKDITELKAIVSELNKVLDKHKSEEYLSTSELRFMMNQLSTKKR